MYQYNNVDFHKRGINVTPVTKLCNFKVQVTDSTNLISKIFTISSVFVTFS